MTTLLIKDLVVTEELDRKAMASVRGGTSKGAYPMYWAPYAEGATNEFKFDASQLLSQSQNTLVNNGNNVAFSDHITATVNPHQDGHNTIRFG